MKISLPQGTGTFIAALVMVGAFALIGSGCGINEPDPSRIPITTSDADYVEVYRSGNSLPDVVKLCVNGLGFVTTGYYSESYGASFERMTEWDAECQGKIRVSDG